MMRGIRFWGRKYVKRLSGLVRSVALVVACLALGTSALSAQSGWGDLDGLIARHLGEPLAQGNGVWLPDHSDPAVATQALAFYYFTIPNGGNAIRLNVGFFRQTGQGFQYVGPVFGLFGNGPRDTVYTPGRLQLTTTVLGPNEPRCCPTAVARWLVDTNTLAVTRLQ